MPRIRRFNKNTTTVDTMAVYRGLVLIERKKEEIAVATHNVGVKRAALLARHKKNQEMYA